MVRTGGLVASALVAMDRMELDVAEKALADGSALQITIWKIVSPEKREINRIGQSPHEEIAPDPTGATDPVLEAAKQWVVTQPQP